MLKKIAIHDLRLGMHLHELCRPWPDHPFWRAKFLLADPAATKAQMPVPPELLDLNHPGCSERISGRESNAVWKFKHLDELWAGAEVLAKARRSGSQKP